MVRVGVQEERLPSQAPKPYRQLRAERAEREIQEIYEEAVVVRGRPGPGQRLKYYVELTPVTRSLVKVA